MEKMINPIHKKTPLDEIFKQWPQTAVLFNHYGMSCPGCYLNHFERLETALSIYQVPVETFLLDINRLIADGE
jgi:hybrid cluster-associated redox disulfide protein